MRSISYVLPNSECSTQETYGFFHCVVQLGSARFAFPLQFSTALEWAGLFTCRYSCAASTAVSPEKLFNSASLNQALDGSAPRLSTRGTSVLPKETTKQPFLGC